MSENSTTDWSEEAVKKRVINWGNFSRVNEDMKKLTGQSGIWIDGSNLQNISIWVALNSIQNRIKELEKKGNVQKKIKLEGFNLLDYTTPKRKEVWDLYYKEHKSPEEIGKILGKSAGQVKDLLHCAKTDLEKAGVV